MGEFYNMFFDPKEVMDALKIFDKNVEERKRKEGIEDTRALVELSLDIHNEEMFKEYTNKYKKLISNKIRR